MVHIVCTWSQTDLDICFSLSSLHAMPGCNVYLDTGVLGDPMDTPVNESDKTRYGSLTSSCNLHLALNLEVSITSPWRTHTMKYSGHNTCTKKCEVLHLDLPLSLSWNFAKGVHPIYCIRWAFTYPPPLQTWGGCVTGAWDPVQLPGVILIPRPLRKQPGHFCMCVQTVYRCNVKQFHYLIQAVNINQCLWVVNTAADENKSLCSWKQQWHNCFYNLSL